MRFPLKRHPKNPLIVPKDMPFDCYSVFNAGAIIHNKKVLLILRSENMERQTQFHVATSDNGIDFEISPKQIEYPLGNIEKEWGTHRFDMRITKIDNTYMVFHAVWLGGGLGSCIGLAKTDDFIHFEQISLSTPTNRNAVLFPEKINGMYCRLERPQTGTGGIMWVSYSPDLIHWGNAKPIKLPWTTWSEHKQGAGIVPIKTKKGWLEIYHATTLTASTENYHLGVVVLDLEDPSKIISAPKKMILAAEKDYECVGQVPNVVFTGGAVEMPDGTLNVYYGGADTRMCLAQTSIDELLTFCGL